MIDQDKRKEIKNKLKNLALFKDDKFVLKIDLTTMNFIIAFITNKSSFRTRRNLSNCQKLFNKIHDSSFNTQGLIDRAWIIRKLLYAMLNEGIESDLDYLISYLSEDSECTDSIKDIIADIKKLKINYEECKHIVNKINDMLEFGYSVNYKEVMKDLINMIDDGEFKDYKSIQNDLYDIAVAITNIKRNARSLDNEQSFSLDPEIFDVCIEDAVTKLQDKNRIFLTGVQRWNTILSPGYISKKLYVYLAFPGKGKSTVLLKSALDMKKYNPEIETKDPDKKPTVLFLTLENTIEETIERIYNMTVDSDDIRNYTPKQVIKKLKKDGGLELTNKNNFNIVIKEFKNRELDTNDLYTLIMDENDKGNEVVALIVDYMKRIRPAERANDEKGELKNISNELKEIAKFFDIPVNNIAA